MSKANRKYNTILLNKSLAAHIGLNEAIVLTLIIDWLALNEKHKKNFIEGRYWTYNTYGDLHDQLPFMSVSTIRRTIKALETDGLIISRNDLNTLEIDKTKWYAVDPVRVDQVLKEIENKHLRLPNLSTPLPSSKQKNKTYYKDNETNPDKNTIKIKLIHPDSTDENYRPLVSLIDRYMNNYYVQAYGKKHPALKHDQFMKVYNALASFCNDFGVDPDEMDPMIVDFFNNVKSRDHRIHHFIQENILKNRYYATLWLK